MALASDEELDMTFQSEDEESTGGWKCRLDAFRRSKRLLIASVFVALMFDSILLTAVGADNRIETQPAAILKSTHDEISLHPARSRRAILWQTASGNTGQSVPVLPAYLHEVASDERLNASPWKPPWSRGDAGDDGHVTTGSDHRSPQSSSFDARSHEELLEQWMDSTPINMSYLWTDWELALHNWTYLPNLTDFSDEDYELWQSSSSSSTSSSSSSSSFNYQREASTIGWLFASKAIVQLITNPIVGTFINRYGHGMTTMIVGVVVLLTSSLLYALGENYAFMFLGRAIHGFGSSCVGIAGMALLAQAYDDDKKRSQAMGIALGGFSLGVLAGYPYGGFMFEFSSKSAVFLLIAALLTVYIVLITCFMPSHSEQKDSVNLCGEASLFVLLRDPYILVAAGAVLFPEMSMALIEPTLPPWMMDTMHPKHWQIGTVFVPDSLGFFIGCNLFAVISVRLGRWIVAIFCLVLMAVSLFCIPMATAVPHLIAPHFGLGLSLGAIDASMFPLLAHLVDTRHVAVYGAVYAIAQVSVSIGFAVGPVAGGVLVEWIGFTWLLRGMALLNLLYAPLCYLLRNPPTKEENTAILMRENGSKQSTELYTSDVEGFSYKPINED